MVISPILCLKEREKNIILKQHQVTQNLSKLILYVLIYSTILLDLHKLVSGKL